MDGAEGELTSSVWWGSEAMEERGFGLGGRRHASGISPRGALFLKTISRRLIVSMDLYFHFLSLVLRQNSLSLLVNMNSAQLKDACDQGQTVETCCARKNKLLS